MPESAQLDDDLHQQYQIKRREGAKEACHHIPLMIRSESGLDAMDRRDRLTLLRVVLNSKFAVAHGARELLAELVESQSGPRLVLDPNDRAQQHRRHMRETSA